MEGSRREVSWGWTIAWTPVFAANLIVPYALSSGMVGESAKPGICAGMVFYWILGLAACVALPRLGRRLVRGGIIVGVSQFFPILQVVAGLVALEFAQGVESRGPRLLGFVEVMITEGMLQWIALVLGCFIDLFDAWTESPNEKPRPADWPLAD